MAINTPNNITITLPSDYNDMIETEGYGVTLHSMDQNGSTISGHPDHLLSFLDDLTIGDKEIQNDLWQTVRPSFPSPYIWLDDSLGGDLVNDPNWPGYIK